MNTTLKAFTIALALIGGTIATVTTASANPDAYSWAYPDNFKRPM